MCVVVEEVSAEWRVVVKCWAGVFFCNEFFFFKQKTAYEIGTGDWSSDVCSSDLFTVSSCALFMGPNFRKI